MSLARSTLVGCIAACALQLGGAAAAAADDPPPDLSQSTIACTPANAVPPLLGTTRPGDFVLCQLTASVAGPAKAFHVTGEISIPAGTVYDPPPNAQGVPVPADLPTKVTFDESKLGLISQDFPKVASIRLRIADDTEPDTPIQPVGTVRDPQAATVTATANLLTVMPKQADLSPSATVCENADPTRPDVRAGDTLSCRYVLVNMPKRENAVDLSLSGTIPSGTTWAPGGNETFHFGINLSWFGDVLAPGVPSGGSGPPLDVRLAVDPALPGGSVIYVSATVGWTNALSRTADQVGLAAAAITVHPGPALLSASALTCADVDGGTLLAGDLLDCTASIRPAAGHEDVADVTGSAAVPALTSAVTAADATGHITLPSTALGSIAAGATRAATYRLRVATAAQPGNVIVPTALISGRSVPSGVALSLPLQSAPLIVGSRPVAPVAATAKPGVAAVAAVTPAGSRAPVICGSRRVVTVNVRPPKGKHWKSVTFSFSTKSVKGTKATGSRGKQGYFRGRLVFEGLPKGPLKVSIKGVTTGGKTVRSTRTYNLCTQKK